MKAVKVTADNGDVYEATKSDGGPWEISFPEGSDRYHGTEAEVRSHIRRLIKSGSAAKVAP
ncbi:hypothetical protein [Ensifer aridi]|uniref:hypothetical protein n=1 Tax=Ensifer aridi TaxID=1708715 RepID=UPI000A120AAF|nr:hypothetical protein [Ensifer aridi]